jgi:hypothetical protein
MPHLDAQGAAPTATKQAKYAIRLAILTNTGLAQLARLARLLVQHALAAMSMNATLVMMIW